MNLQLTDSLKIIINEQEYLILKPEGEIFLRACDDVKKMNELYKLVNPTSHGEIHKIAKEGVDFILGENSFDKIVANKAVSVPTAVEIYSSICELCFDKYVEHENDK